MSRRQTQQQVFVKTGDNEGDLVMKTVDGLKSLDQNINEIQKGGDETVVGIPLDQDFESRGYSKEEYNSKEETIQVAIDYVDTNGGGLVFINHLFLPYDPSQVTFSDSVGMVVNTDQTEHRVNVKAWGARADGPGGSDDKPAIDAAASYADANNIDEVFHPPGTYTVSGALNFVGNTRPVGVSASYDGVTTNIPSKKAYEDDSNVFKPQQQFDSGLDTRGDVVDDQGNTIYDYSGQQIPQNVTSERRVLDSFREVGSVQDDTLLEDAHDVAWQGDMAAIGGKGSAVALVDISTPSDPSIIGSITGLTNPQTVEFGPGGTLFIGDDSKGLSIVDVSDASDSTVLANDASRDRINGMCFWGHYAIVADKDNEIGVYDIEDRDSIGHFLGGQINSPHDVDISNGYVVGVNQADGATPKVRIWKAVDHSTGTMKTNWTRVASFSASNMNGTNRVICRWPYAYVSNNIDATTSIIDISDPANPVRVGQVNQGGNGLALAGDWLIVSSGQVIDISNPTNPVDKGNFSIAGGTPDHDLEVYGQHILMTDQDENKMLVQKMDHHNIPGLRVGSVRADTVDVGDYLHAKDVRVKNSLMAPGATFYGTVTAPRAQLMDQLLVGDISNPDPVANTSLQTENTIKSEGGFRSEGKQEVVQTNPEVDLIDDSGNDATSNLNFYTNSRGQKDRQWQIQYLESSDIFRVRERLDFDHTVLELEKGGDVSIPSGALSQLGDQPTDTAASAGNNGDVPNQVAFFIKLAINGSTHKIPVYNT